MPKFLRTTAAWRISIWTTLAFALGTAVAFSIVYSFVAKTIQGRSDTWLSGEAAVLARVSKDTPQDRLYNRIVREVAELATEELPDDRSANGQKLNTVFFLEIHANSNDAPLWVGPGPDDLFLKAIQKTNPAPGVPQSIDVQGWRTPFRVVTVSESGRTIYLGLSSRGDDVLLRRLTRRFLILWGSTVLMGFLISYLSAYRTLLRVQRITDTVAHVSSKDLGERLPQPVNSDEISRLAKTFNHMLDRIQSSVNELHSVTDAVAHDLKSPVTSIRGNLESLLSGASNAPNDVWKDSVGEAVESLDRLLTLLDTTLDVAEAQAGALRLDRCAVDVSAVVRQMLDLYQPSMDEHNHTLNIDLEDQVFVDADWGLLHRSLSNLIENEIAHLPSGCHISVSLHSHEASAILVIEDNGPGFPPDIRTRAFERFVRGKQSRGHGLGLALVDAVVRAHGGKANISDRPGGGAVITLTLPVSVLPRHGTLTGSPA